MTDAGNHALEIQVNGETREVSPGLTVAGLILELDLQPSRVAIELNRSVVHRNQWAATILHEGDRVEIVHFVGGGQKPSWSQYRERFDRSASVLVCNHSPERQRGNRY